MAARDRPRPDRRRPQARRPLARGARRRVATASSWSASPAPASRSPRSSTAIARPSTGIVRRPYPSGDGPPVRRSCRVKADRARRPGQRPRGVARNPAAGAGGTGPASGPGSSPVGAGPAAASSPTAPDANLADLASVVGRTVRVGGLVGDLLPDGFMLDDGTATGPVVLTGAAADLLAAHRAGRRDQRRRPRRVDGPWLDRRRRRPGGHRARRATRSPLASSADTAGTAPVRRHGTCTGARRRTLSRAWAPSRVFDAGTAGLGTLAALIGSCRWP